MLKKIVQQTKAFYKSQRYESVKLGNIKEICEGVKLFSWNFKCDENYDSQVAQAAQALPLKNREK